MMGVFAKADKMWDELVTEFDSAPGTQEREDARKKLVQLKAVVFRLIDTGRVETDEADRAAWARWKAEHE